MREILARRLKQCREEKGLTQDDMALYCGVPQKTYQGYELATREPKLEILLRIAERFEVSTDYLVGRGDKQQVNR